MKKLSFLIVLTILCGSLSAQNLVEAEYFIDEDPGVGNALEISIPLGEDIEASFDFDIPVLDPGIHCIGIRVKDENGNWGLFTNELFYVNEVFDQEITSMEYFRGEDPGVGNGTSVDPEMGLIIDETFDTEQINADNGIDCLKVRVQNASGNWGLFTNETFYVRAEVDQEITAMEYFRGVDPGVGNGIAVDPEIGLIIDETFETENFSDDDGIQSLKIRVKNAGGNWGLYSNEIFHIRDITSPNDIESIEYFIDEDPGVGLGESLSFEPGMDLDQVLEIPVAEDLEVGEHLLHIRVQHSGGNWSLYATHLFEVDNTIGVSESSLNLKVYPNPTADFINIQTESPIKGLELFSDQGKRVAIPSALDSRIDLSALATGSYILRIHLEGATVTRLIVKE